MSESVEKNGDPWDQYCTNTDDLMRAYWNQVRRHYAMFEADILAAPANEWAIDPYAWQFLAGVSMSPIEAAMWGEMRVEGVVFYPQYPVGRFFVDFGNPVARVAIECDGRAFHQDWAKDRARQDEIEAAGWRVYRLSGRACLQESLEVEDRETGEIVDDFSASRQLLRHLADTHGLRIGRTGKGVRRIGEIAPERVAHWQRRFGA